MTSIPTQPSINLHSQKCRGASLSSEAKEICGAPFHSPISTAAYECWRAFPKVAYTMLGETLSYRAAQLLNPSIRYKKYTDIFNIPCTQPFALKTNNFEFSWGLMQTKESLRIAIKDVIDQFAANNVVYGEIQVAPFKHTQQSLSPNEVMTTILSAITTNTRRLGLKCGLILASDKPADHAEHSVIDQLVEFHASKGIIGRALLAKNNNWSCHQQAYPLSSHQQPVWNEYELKKRHLEAISCSNAPETVKQEIARLIRAFQSKKNEQQ